MFNTLLHPPVYFLHPLFLQADPFPKLINKRAAGFSADEVADNHPKERSDKADVLSDCLFRMKS